MIPCKIFCSHPPPPCLGRGRPRAQGQRVIASQHDLPCCCPHTLLPPPLFLWETENCNSANSAESSNSSSPPSCPRRPGRAAALAKKFGRTATLEVESCFKSKSVGGYMTEKGLNMGCRLSVAAGWRRKWDPLLLLLHCSQGGFLTRRSTMVPVINSCKLLLALLQIYPH